jgi:hypothetical protein
MLVGKTSLSNILENIGVDRRMMLKRTLKKCDNAVEPIPLEQNSA